jgi:ferredoxin
MSKEQTGLVIYIAGHKPLPYSGDTTILECLEAHKIPAPFHCRDGFCGACRSKLTQGQVDYTTDPLAYIDDDEILTCCSKAITDIYIELNE